MSAIVKLDDFIFEVLELSLQVWRDSRNLMPIGYTHDNNEVGYLKTVLIYPCKLGLLGDLMIPQKLFSYKSLLQSWLVSLTQLEGAGDRA